MCGIFGSITGDKKTLNKIEKEKRNGILTGLALVMEKRGDHSTGIAGIDRKFTSVYKKAMPAHEFVNTTGFKDVLSYNHQVYIGHTRLATVGAITDKNAHPFTFGNVVGVHNGHVMNYKQINDEIKVDSEAIFYLLDKYKNDYKKAFSELYGQFAIAWFDKAKPNQLNLVSDGNPIKIIYIDDIKTYFFASEEYPLASVVGSHFILDKKRKVWTPSESKLYTIDTKLQIKTNRVSFKDYSSYHQASSYDSRSAYNCDDEVDYRYPADEIEKDIPPDNEEFSYERIHGCPNPFRQADSTIDEYVLDNIGDMNFEELKNIIFGIERKGCFYCGISIDWEEDEGCYYYSLGKELVDKHIVCTPCMGGSELDMNKLIWIGHDEYMEIKEETEELIESKKIQLYAKKIKANRKQN